MRPNLPEQPVTSRRSLSLLKKLERMTHAWRKLAPDTQIARMSFPEFQSAVGPSFEIRQKLLQTRVEIRSLAGKRLEQEAFLSAQLRRVIAAVCADRHHGENSALYRAMGMVTPSARRPTGAAAHGKPAGAPRPRIGLLERYHTMVAAWKELGVESAEGIRFSEWTLAGEQLLATLNQLQAAKALHCALVGDKQRHDRASRTLLKRVAAGVMAHPQHGENSDLYRAMGYVPLRERKRPRPRIPKNHSSLPSLPLIPSLPTLLLLPAPLPAPPLRGEFVETPLRGIAVDTPLPGIGGRDELRKEPSVNTNAIESNRPGLVPTQAGPTLGTATKKAATSRDCAQRGAGFPTRDYNQWRVGNPPSSRCVNGLE